MKKKRNSMSTYLKFNLFNTDIIYRYIYILSVYIVRLTILDEKDLGLNP